VTDREGAPGGERGWAEAYRRLAARLTHEIRNPLNGAVVNLEVLRSRSARADLSATALQPFAAAAAEETARAIALVESLLMLARPAPAPVDLAETLRPLAVLLDALASRAGGSVAVERGGAASSAAVDGDTARLALVQAVEPALESGAAIRCRISEAAARVEVRVAGGALPPAARGARIDDTTMHAVENGVLISFPRSGAASERP
jgi:signal transduction histidine kinase